jgi:hypothetical protein
VSPEELERRRPVWVALSELWLDSEFDDALRERLAEELARSPFDERELRAIHEHEVAPVLASNLASVAGEWGGFDPKWLEARCLDAAQRRPGAAARWWARLQFPGRRALVGALLDDVLARVVRLRSARD